MSQLTFGLIIVITDLEQVELNVYRVSQEINFRKI